MVEELSVTLLELVLLARQGLIVTHRASEGIDGPWTSP
jgi:hypothetical protein